MFMEIEVLFVCLPVVNIVVLCGDCLYELNVKQLEFVFALCVMMVSGYILLVFNFLFKNHEQGRAFNFIHLQNRILLIVYMKLISLNIKHVCIGNKINNFSLSHSPSLSLSLYGIPPRNVRASCSTAIVCILCNYVT